jgi:hypothetical protein
MLQLFTHTTQPGWRAMRVSGSAEKTSSGKTANEITVAATRGDDGDTTIYILNRSLERSDVRIDSLDPSKKYFVTAWNSDGGGGIVSQGSVQSDGHGTIEQSIAGFSLVALSTTRPRL